MPNKDVCHLAGWENKKILAVELGWGAEGARVLADARDRKRVDRDTYGDETNRFNADYVHRLYSEDGHQRADSFLRSYLGYLVLSMLTIVLSMILGNDLVFAKLDFSKRR